MIGKLHEWYLGETETALANVTSIFEVYEDDLKFMLVARLMTIRWVKLNSDAVLKTPTGEIALDGTTVREYANILVHAEDAKGDQGLQYFYRQVGQMS